MAGVSTKEIKTRIRSMQSTRQITKAMEMVAASKLRKAQNQALAARPYFETLSACVAQIAASKPDFESPYLSAPSGKTAYVVFAGDRGLAGGYNSNVLKLAYREMEGQSATVLPIGKKAGDFFLSRKAEILSHSWREAEDVSVSDCFTIARLLCKAYLAGEITCVKVVYTNFVSVLSQVPESMQLLPLVPGRATEGKAEDILYEPDPETVFSAIVPEYLGGILYGALCESRASEQAARRTAMDSATQNADEMIEDLNLRFNRARQAAITQEITEIVAGA